jgi:hypothetical protein
MLLNTPLALTARRLLRYRKAFVNDAEMAIVVQYTFVVAVDREYINPKIDVGLQLRGQRESFIGKR